MALITISSVTIGGWQGNTNGVCLRIYTNADFTAQTGTLYPKSVLGAPSSLGTFFQSYACTVSGNSLTIPQVQIDSTTDSPDNPAATYTAQLWDSTSGKPIQNFGTFSQFSLNPTPATTTWASVFAAEANT